MTHPLPSVLTERLHFMQIDAQTGALLHAFWPVVEPKIQQVLDGFYNHVMAIPALKQMLGNQVPRL